MPGESERYRPFRIDEQSGLTAARKKAAQYGSAVEDGAFTTGSAGDGIIRAPDAGKLANAVRDEPGNAFLSQIKGGGQKPVLNRGFSTKAKAVRATSVSPDGRFEATTDTRLGNVAPSRQVADRATSTRADARRVSMRADRSQEQKLTEHIGPGAVGEQRPLGKSAYTSSPRHKRAASSVPGKNTLDRRSKATRKNAAIGKKDNGKGISRRLTRASVETKAITDGDMQEKALSTSSFVGAKTGSGVLKLGRGLAGAEKFGVIHRGEIKSAVSGAAKFVGKAPKRIYSVTRRSMTAIKARAQRYMQTVVAFFSKNKAQLVKAAVIKLLPLLLIATMTIVPVIVLFAQIPSLSLKSTDKELNRVYEYITELDAEFNQKVRNAVSSVSVGGQEQNVYTADQVEAIYAKIAGYGGTVKNYLVDEASGYTVSILYPNDYQADGSTVYNVVLFLDGIYTDQHSIYDKLHVKEAVSYLQSTMHNTPFLFVSFGDRGYDNAHLKTFLRKMQTQTEIPVYGEVWTPPAGDQVKNHYALCGYSMGAIRIANELLPDPELGDLVSSIGFFSGAYDCFALPAAHYSYMVASCGDAEEREDYSGLYFLKWFTQNCFPYAAVSKKITYQGCGFWHGNPGTYVVPLLEFIPGAFGGAAFSFDLPGSHGADEVHYYVNGSTVGANYEIQTDIDFVLQYLDAKYEDYALDKLIYGLFGGTNVKDELRAIHDAMYSYTTRTWIETVALEPEVQDDDTYDEDVYVEEEITHLDVNIVCKDFEKTAKAEGYLTDDEMASLDALLEIGAFTTRNELRNPFEPGNFWYVKNRWGYYFDGSSVLQHGGIDIQQRPDAPVYCCRTGTVTFAGDAGGHLGTAVKIKSGNSEVTYGHLADLTVSVGQTVSKGTQIGQVGPERCLHLSYNRKGEEVNPLFYLSGYINNGGNQGDFTQAQRDIVAKAIAAYENPGILGSLPESRTGAYYGCGAFVMHVYRAAGQRCSGRNAINYWTDFQETGGTERSVIPVGALVVSAAGGEGGATYGHVGIYIGGGEVIHFGDRVYRHTLEQFCRFCGENSVTVNNGQVFTGYQGWVWPDGIVLGTYADNTGY